MIYKKTLTQDYTVKAFRLFYECYPDWFIEAINNFDAKPIFNADDPQVVEGFNVWNNSSIVNEYVEARKGDYIVFTQDHCLEVYGEYAFKEQFVPVNNQVKYYWQFEDRGGKPTERPVCSGCGASPAYYLPGKLQDPRWNGAINDIADTFGISVCPPFCHECGSKMEKEVKWAYEENSKS